VIEKYQFIKDMAKLPFVDRIILFGSRARKDNEERADIDLAIDCKQATEGGWSKILALATEGDTLLSVDCVRLDGLEKDDVLRGNILKQGKTIYSKEGGFMSKEYLGDSFELLGQAVGRLREAFDKAKGELKEVLIYRDATIQRFEFTVELFWKTLKKFLSYERLKANTPREVLKKSYMAQIIEDEKEWLRMMDDRNLTSHTYQETVAREIFGRIEVYLPLLEKTYKELERRYEKM
jgi:nucleotidyltransferase substrate binding protein (TIGR01987 family)